MTVTLRAAERPVADPGGTVGQARGMTYSDQEPMSEGCEVLLEDARRVEGWLEAWRQEGDGWRGWVRYSTGLGGTRVGWFHRRQLTEGSDAGVDS